MTPTEATGGISFGTIIILVGAAIAILIYLVHSGKIHAEKLGKVGDFLDDFKMNNSNVATAAPVVDHPAIVTAALQGAAAVIAAAPAPVIVAGGSPMQGVDYSKPLPQLPPAPPAPPAPPPSNPGQVGITVGGPGQGGGGPATPAAPADFSNAPTQAIVIDDDRLRACGYDIALDGQNVIVGVGENGPFKSVVSSAFVAALPFKGARTSFIKNTPTKDYVEVCVSPTAGDFTYRRTDGVINYLMLPPGTDGYDFNVPAGHFFNTRTANPDNGWFVTWHKA